MFENLYTTKMSEDAETIKNRFFKIRSENSKSAKILAIVLFVVLIIAIACVSVIVAVNTYEDYSMSEERLNEYINRPMGAIMADIDYADEEKIVFHYLDGMFVYNYKENKIVRSFDLTKLNCALPQQGSHSLNIYVSDDGKEALLENFGVEEEIKDFDDYMINLENGTVRKTKVDDTDEMIMDNAFQGIAQASWPADGTWRSTTCIILGEKSYWLLIDDTYVNALQLAISDGNEISYRYIFGEKYASTAEKKSRTIRDALSDGEEILVNSGLNREVNEDKLHPSDIYDIKDAELVVGNERYFIKDYNDIGQIEKLLSSAKMIKGGTACPFTALLVLTRNDGKTGRITIATDSCAVFKSGDMYYDYSDGDNSEFLGYFGLDATVISDMTFGAGNKESKSAVPVINSFFDAFAVSDIEAMKLLSTDEAPIDEGYKMCYGMTRADLQSIQDTDIDEFLKNYLARPKHTQFEFSDEEIELLKNRSDKLKVYTVTVLAESNIKGEIKPSYYNTFEVVCEMQENGEYLVHKFVN